jgi:uncharacterized protein YukE
MTWMVIDADDVAALGRSLGEVADDLHATRDGSVDRWALGCGQASEAFDDLLSGWRRNRLLLAEVLNDLGERAQAAGTAYVVAEDGARHRFGGETR